MKALQKLMNKPLIGGFVRALMKRLANDHATMIAKHFSQYLTPRIANSDELRRSAFAIRHHVYCEELQFEPVNELKQERDEFDHHAHHCVIQHNASEKFAGTVRVVYSRNETEQLPLERYCLDSISHERLHPNNFPRDSICEISRLAVPQEFRRRQTDNYDGAATGVINEATYSESELRCFPFIAVGLYLAAATVTIEKGLAHCFVMMEPRLARSMRFVGIEFEQIGPVVEYHGKRAPFYISPITLKTTLSNGYRALFHNIELELARNEALHVILEREYQSHLSSDEDEWQNGEPVISRTV